MAASHRRHIDLLNPHIDLLAIVESRFELVHAHLHAKGAVVILHHEVLRTPC
jgi:hypothetical protein